MRLSRRTAAYRRRGGHRIPRARPDRLFAGGSGDGGSDEPITLTVTTFGTIGYDDLYAQYEDENPNITIKATNIDTGGNARTDCLHQARRRLRTLRRQSRSKRAGSAPSWRSPTSSSDLSDYGIEDRKADWVDWKYAQAHRRRRPRHRLRHRHRTGGRLLQRPAFAAAGLPTDRDEVAAVRLDGDWEQLLRGRPGSTTTRPARRGTTTPGSSGTPWSTSCRRATTPPTAS